VGPAGWLLPGGLPSAGLSRSGWPGSSWRPGPARFPWGTDVPPEWETDAPTEPSVYLL